MMKNVFGCLSVLLGTVLPSGSSAPLIHRRPPSGSNLSVANITVEKTVLRSSLNKKKMKCFT